LSPRKIRGGRAAGGAAELPEDVAAQAYDATLKGFHKDGALDMEGVRNVLKLRAQFEGGTPATPEKYIDLSYYQKALQGL